MISSKEVRAVAINKGVRFYEDSTPMHIHMLTERPESEVTDRLVNDSFRSGPSGTIHAATAKVLPPVSHLSKYKNHSDMKSLVIQRLEEFFERFFGLITNKRD